MRSSTFYSKYSALNILACFAEIIRDILPYDCAEFKEVTLLERFYSSRIAKDFVVSASRQCLVVAPGLT